MKKTLLLLYIFLFSLSSTAQLVTIPDANFKTALLNHVPVINTNGDGEIQVSEALAFNATMNVGSKNITDLTGINAFTNLKELVCYSNKLTSISISGLNALTYLNCSQNLITALNLNNLPALQILYCGSNSLTVLSLSSLPQLQELMCAQNKFTALSLSSLLAIKTINLQDCNLMTTLSLDNMPNLISLNCGYCNLATLTMTGLTGLQTLTCINNQLSSLTLSNPAVLQELSADNNQLTALPPGLSTLKNLSAINNKISVFALDNLSFLQSVRIFNNLCTSLTLSNKSSLISIYCQNNLINNLSLSNLPSLKNLYCYQNQLTTLTLNDFPSLESVRCYNNQLTSLTLTNVAKLKDFMCYNNKLTTLSLSNMPLLQWIQCQSNLLNNITLGNLPALYEIFCDNNQLTSLPFFNSSVLPKLQSISLSGNKLPRLIVQNYPVLGQIIAGNNPIDSISLKGLPDLTWLSVEKIPLKLLALDSLPKLRVLYCGKTDSLRSVSLKLPALEQFYCDSSKLVEADLSQTKVFQCIVPHNPLLQYINLRNNTVGNSFYPYNFSNNPLLNFICVDSSEANRITDSVHRQLPGQGIVVSTICNYVLAPVQSTIRGTVRLDFNGNGCNNTDSTIMNIRINNNDGLYSTTAFTNSSGQYIFHTASNSDTVKVALQQPSWFNVTPPMHIINIPSPGITAIANFCITPVAVHPDLEIILLPLSVARPGFDAQYKIVYKNNGNQVQSGNISLAFDVSKLNFLSAVPNILSQTPGNLSWTFSSLSPFETRTINVVFHVNPPPTVNIGDILSFTAVINPIAADETPLDNTFNFNQIVRGAFDPNDKQVTEGAAIDISQTGAYLHYLIRFQNTGNEAAINVTIKDSLADNLDWNSLVPVAASHAYTGSINKSNQAAFIFSNINLPGKTMNEPASHGFIAFKIKPKSNITVGATVYNTAAIYFDFNLPIITNTVATTITNAVKTNDAVGLSVYPNPVKDIILFAVKPGVQIKSIRLFNSVGKKIYAENISTTATAKKITIANLPTGILFLEVISTQGKAIQKIISIK